MNRGYHQWMVSLAAFFLLSTLAIPQTNPRNKQMTSLKSVCPLSDDQFQKSTEAFGKIFPIFQEPRCLNCHGGVNPFVEGLDPDGRATTAHGGGKMDPVVEDDNGKITSKGTDCDGCHDDMAPKRGGGTSHWHLPSSEDFFIGQDAENLCMNMKFAFKEFKDFIGHLKDDNGMDNFVGTAFKGNRGVTAKDQEKGFALKPPHMNHASLLSLGDAWGASTGGEFKGSYPCGCVPEHYAIRVSQSTDINVESIHHTSILKPVDIPITFEDDGSFTGEGEGAYEAGGTAAGCTEQSTAHVQFHVSGQAIEQYQKNTMHLEVEFPSPLAYSFSAQCEGASDSMQTDIPAMNIKSSFDMKGDVGEKIDRKDETMPGIISEYHLEIVKLKSAE
jgi:hypothetical protein